MGRIRFPTRLAQIAIGVAAMVALPGINPVHAQTTGDDEGWSYGSGRGPGMMGDYGYGMGPGRGGYGYGPGRMWGDGDGYGPGDGYGRGMWGYHGGYGYGPGMMGGYRGLGALNLSDDQRSKINKLVDDERHQRWSIMGKMLDEQTVLRDLYEQDQPDPKKVGAAYGEIAKLRQQMVELHVQTQNQIEKLLTKEQRDQLRQWRHGGWGPGWGPRSGYGPKPGPGNATPGR